MRSILIGVDGGAGSADAVAFGGALADRRGPRRRPGQVEREAACSVIVVPDGGERPEAVLVGEREGTGALVR